MRRYKYLEKMFEDEMKKILIFIKGFTELERIKLARMTALWISNGSVPPTVLLVLINVCIDFLWKCVVLQMIGNLILHSSVQHSNNFSVVCS